MPTRSSVRVAVFDGGGRQGIVNPSAALGIVCSGDPESFAFISGGLDDLGSADAIHVVLMDVDAGNANWTDVVAEVSAKLGCEVVALVERPESALLAFEAGCADCVLKPPDRERLRRAIARAVALRHAKCLLATRMRPSPWRIELPDRNGGKSVAMGDVIRVEAARDYVLIHSVGHPFDAQVHIVRATMAELERALPKPVVRVHRSAMVSMAFVRGWTPPGQRTRKLLLSDGTRVPVGPAYVASTRLAFREWLRGYPA